MAIDQLKQQIAELREAEAKATPGPWEFWCSQVMKGRRVLLLTEAEHKTPVCEDCQNVSFTIAMRNSLPSLLDKMEALIEVATIAQRFGSYAQALGAIAAEQERDFHSTNGWSDLDPVLGAKGQVLTMGDFRLLAAALAKLDALGKEQA